MRNGRLAAIALLLLAIPNALSQVTAVEGVSIVVSDLDRMTRWYHDMLDFTSGPAEELSGDAFEHLEGLFGARAKAVRLTLGSESIQLVQYLTPQGRPIPVDSNSNDGWFQHIAIVVSDMDKAFERLRLGGVTFASTGPQRLPDWNPNAGGIRAFYFKDPDGHVLETIWFPAGKGDPRWQRPSERLFLGIDHTAIVVRNTAASLAFYGDTLGLRLAGESENYGVEQEHLNNVFGARLHISGLRAPSGPGIEFLEYLAPSDGRPYPADARSSDLASWQTRLLVANPATEASKARLGGGRWVSPGAVTLPSPLLGLTTGALLRDPDGHAVMLMRSGER